jgi:hypothetical protein
MKTARRKFAKEQKQDLPVETNRFNENATQSSGECAGFLDRPDPYTLPSDAEERPQVSLGLTVDMSLIYGRSRCFKTPQVDNPRRDLELQEAPHWAMRCREAHTAIETLTLGDFHFEIQALPDPF